ncbi:3-keto-5-aminohexanoate cleavage protein [Chthonobacter rhizosphaerae]|uniref:3-keto-5-aminohexanoate cleavage protein n=1 Tax=Chthonobacter rhizosphaerae TaxID=2735553 RepID=UPI0015EE47D1|nr:3-keto-5-aminohexanoate cleavage protein [Chthonobacter rhizosphaerae]
MIQAALNGGRSRRFHPAVPCTPAELARAAAAAVEAGAACLHIHPRDAADRESLDPAVIAPALEAVRRAVPGTPVGVSTGRWIAPGGEARHDAIRRWTVLPDYVSVNLIEPDSAEVISLALAGGIGVEAGVWSPADVDRLAAHKDAGRCLRLLMEINEQDPADAIAVFEATLARADQRGIRLPILAHGLDAGFWAVHAAAMARGLDTRAGLEDCAFRPTGAVARDNADAIAAALTFRHDRPS